MKIPAIDTVKAFRQWWVFYIDPTTDDHTWKSAGMIAGRFTAEEAIQQTVGRSFDQPYWAFALDKGKNGSYYDLHYPEGMESPVKTPIGPAGYVAE